MKKLSYLFVFVLVLSLLVGCANAENASVTETNTGVTTEVIAENEEVNAEDSSSSEVADVSDIIFETDVDMRRLTGIYTDEGLLIIHEDKMVFAEIYAEDVVTYDIVSVGLEDDMIVDGAIFGETYRITGKAANGDELIICTDGRLARDYHWDSEYNYAYCTFALRHVSELTEEYLEYLPSTLVVPTFSDEIGEVTLEQELVDTVRGFYYTPETVDERLINETAYAILGDGYIYEWDNGKKITSDADWNKVPIVRIESTDADYFRIINVETRYNTYEYYQWYEDNRIYLKGKYYTKWYEVEADKVDALPSNVPVIQ